MGMRGPKFGAALEIPSVADLRGDARPEPPEDLTPEQAEEWRAVVARLSADWFPRETHGLLAQYCRHVCTARRIARLLAEMYTSEVRRDLLAQEAIDHVVVAFPNRGKPAESS